MFLKIRGILKGIRWFRKEIVMDNSISVIISGISLGGTMALGVFTLILNKKMSNITAYERRKDVYLRTKQFFSNQEYQNDNIKEALSLDINNVFSEEIINLFDKICNNLSTLRSAQFDMDDIMNILKNTEPEKYMWIKNADYNSNNQDELNSVEEFFDNLAYRPIDTEECPYLKELSYREIEQEIDDLKSKINKDKKELYLKMEKKIKKI